jgi:hypothetical protein
MVGRLIFWSFENDDTPHKPINRLHPAHFLDVLQHSPLGFLAKHGDNHGDNHGDRPEYYSPIQSGAADHVFHSADVVPVDTDVWI